MSQYAHFPAIANGVAFSDPWYEKDVLCQYRKDFQDTNWYMKLDSAKGEYDDVNLTMVFGRPSVVGTLKVEMTDDGFSYRHLAHYRVDQVELGIDSAAIFFGSLKDFEIFGESAAFRTGGDGLCGDLIVFTVKGQDQPAGFLLSCSFVEEFVNENDFFRQFLSSFDGQKISKEQFLAGVDPYRLSNRVLLTTESRAAKNADEKGSITPQKDDKPLDRD